MKLMGKKKLEMRFAQFQSENRHLLFVQNSDLTIYAKPRREMISLLYLFVLFIKIKKSASNDTDFGASMYTV
jgi:hypothetical protein